MHGHNWLTNLESLVHMPIIGILTAISQGIRAHRQARNEERARRHQRQQQARRRADVRKRLLRHS